MSFNSVFVPVSMLSPGMWSAVATPSWFVRRKIAGSAIFRRTLTPYVRLVNDRTKGRDLGSMFTSPISSTWCTGVSSPVTSFRTSPTHFSRCPSVGDGPLLETVSSSSSIFCLQSKTSPLSLAGGT